MEFFQKNKATFNSAILSSIYNLSSLGIAVLNLNGTVIEANQALQSMLGYSNEEIIIIGLERISLKEELNKEIILFNKLLNNEIENYKIEKSFICKDKSIRYADVTITLIKDEQEKPKYVLGLINDITEKKIVEQELIKNELKYRVIFEESPVSIIELDLSEVKSYLCELKRNSIKDIRVHLNSNPYEILKCVTKTKVLSINKAGLKLYKVPDLEQYQKYHHKFYTNETFDGFKKAIFSFLNEINSSYSEHSLMSLNGKVHYASRNYLIPDNNIKDWSRCFVTEIVISDRIRAEMELKEKQEFIQSILNAIPSFIYVYDLFEEKIVFLNNSITNITGYSPEDVLQLSKNIQSLIHPEDRHLANFSALLDHTKSCREVVVRLKHKSGNWLWVLDRAFVFKENLAGKPWQIIGSVFDITPRVLAEQKLKESEQKLKELNASKDLFFSIITHDIRNPISIFLNIAELLVNSSQSMNDEEKMYFINELYNSAKNLNSLLSNLLTWSRLQRGKIELIQSKEDIFDISRYVISLIEQYANNKGVKIISNLSQNTFIYADANMVSGIFRNLINNAIKFSHKGSEIIIDAIDRKTYIEISVQDFGIGIKEDDIGKLFKIDSQFTTLGTNKEKGTGLGLILCKEFVEMNTGKIWVESIENSGSTFFFTLPKFIE